jgi:hypothetical protein
MGKTKRHLTISSGGPEVGCEPHLSHSGGVFLAPHYPGNVPAEDFAKTRASRG